MMSGSLRRHPKKPRMRIGLLTASLILAITISFDGLQLLASFFHAIPFIGSEIAFVLDSFLGIVGEGIVAFIFVVFCRVQFFAERERVSGKYTGVKLAALLGPGILEFIPFVNGLLPALTIGALTIILITRKQDREAWKKEGKRLRRLEEAEARRREPILLRSREQAREIEEVIEEGGRGGTFGTGEAGGTSRIPKRQADEDFSPLPAPNAPYSGRGTRNLSDFR